MTSQRLGGAPVTTRRRRSVALACARMTLGVVLVGFLIRRGGEWSSPRLLPAAFWLLSALNLLCLVGAATEARRLGVLLSALDVRLSFWTAFRLVSIATLFSFWIPGGTGGDVMKLYYVAGQNRGRGIEVATALLMDRVLALCTMLMLILALLALQPALVLTVPLVRWLGIAAALVVAALAASALAMWSDRLRAGGLYRLLTKRLPLAHYVVRAADAVYLFKRRKAALAAAALLCLTGHVILSSSLALAGAVLLPGVSAFTVSTLGLLGIVANVLPVTPGGLGVGEAATETLFAAIGAPGGALIVVAWRMGQAALCALGAVFYMIGMRGPDLGAASNLATDGVLVAEPSRRA